MKCGVLDIFIKTYLVCAERYVLVTKMDSISDREMMLILVRASSEFPPGKIPT